MCWRVRAVVKRVSLCCLPPATDTLFFVSLAPRLRTTHPPQKPTPIPYPLRHASPFTPLNRPMVAQLAALAVEVGGLAASADARAADAAALAAQLATVQQAE